MKRQPYTRGGIGSGKEKIKEKEKGKHLFKPKLSPIEGIWKKQDSKITQ